MLSDKIRQKALKKATSPEQLDTMLSVTSAYGWVAAIVLTALAFGFLTWSMFATAPIKTSGRGVMLVEGDVQTVAAPGSGILSQILHETGDHVQQGAILARLENPIMETRIEAAKSNLRRAEEAAQRVRRSNEEFIRSLKEEYAVAEHYHDARTLDLTDKTARLKQQLQEQDDLYAKGLITKTTLQATENALENAQEALIAARYDFSARRTEFLTDLRDADQDIQDHIVAVHLAEEGLAALEADYARSTIVRASETGTLAEVSARLREPVQPGDTLFEILPGQPDVQPTDGLVAVVFVEAFTAASIAPGMAAEVIPAFAMIERDGFIRGEVKTVSALPVTRAHLLMRLGNEALVESLVQSGPVKEVVVSLRQDPNRQADLLWSNGSGPGVPAAIGTLASSNFVIDRKRIASFVFPKLDELLSALRESGVSETASGSRS
jgi:HlyD family secretion protein